MMRGPPAAPTESSGLPSFITMVGDMLEQGTLEVDVLPSHDRWFGMTYRQDRETVAAELRQLHAQGVYPRKLWD